MKKLALADTQKKTLTLLNTLLILLGGGFAFYLGSQLIQLEPIISAQNVKRFCKFNLALEFLTKFESLNLRTQDLLEVENLEDFLYQKTSLDLAVHPFHLLSLKQL